MVDWKEIENKTHENCSSRDDGEASVEKRVKTIAEEAPAWRTLIAQQGALEMTSWAFPESRFKTRKRRALLLDARSALVGAYPQLEVFLKAEEDL